MDQEIHCPGGTKSQSGVAVKERYPNAKISSCGKITDVITRLEIESETYVIPIWNSHAGEVLAADYVWDLIEDHKIQILDIWAKPIHFCFLKKMDTTVIHGKIGSVEVARFQRMMRELGKLSPTWDPIEEEWIPTPHKGWDLLENALKRAELHELQQASKNAFLEIKSIQSRLHEIQQEESIIELFELIKSAAYYASIAPDAALPKKRNTSRAKCNQLILFLKQYLKHHFNTESPSIIAAIVNTAFESADGGITAVDVRKLKPQIGS